MVIPDVPDPLVVKARALTDGLHKPVEVELMKEIDGEEALPSEASIEVAAEEHPVQLPTVKDPVKLALPMT